VRLRLQLWGPYFRGDAVAGGEGVRKGCPTKTASGQASRIKL